MSHIPINPDGLLPPVGFAHGMLAAPGRTLYLGGQTGHHADGRLDDGLVAQFGRALRNLATVLDDAGARPEHVVSMQIFTTDVATYRAEPKALGRAYREVMGRHFPAIALFGVSALHDPDAVVEIVAIAVVPGDPAA
ncbi:RidA family protein [Egicoccus sp. AB-alg2]|uniref:RidA family protein n=1 Tax=Egicoccus sp. AB-alg2 TaxID=3242693 RepID=UPI00359D12C5